MPMNKSNTQTFHRCLYAGELQTITMLARKDDMDAFVVTAYKLFNCMLFKITKRGQQHDGDVTSDMYRNLLIPVFELKRVGVAHINPLFRFVDKQNRYWMPCSMDLITSKMFENYYSIPCQRTDPIPTPGV